jgi:hypothetical protein
MNLGDDPNWISDKSLVDWGIIPQLVDRLIARVQVLPLARDDYRQIARLPDMPLARLERNFRDAGIELVVPDSTVEALLDQLEEGASARGLKSVIIRDLSMRLLYELPEWKAQGVTRVEVSPEFVLDRAPPKLTVPPPPKPLPPELLAARRKVGYGAMDDVDRWRWEGLEQKNAPEDLLKGLAALEADGYSFDNLLFYAGNEAQYGDDFLENVRIFLEDRRAEKEHEELRRATYRTGQMCPVDGRYVFGGYVDRSCRDRVPEDEVWIDLDGGAPFPGAGVNGRPAKWKLIRLGHDERPRGYRGGY